MKRDLRILIIGGYGTFGGRLANLLADDPRLTLIIAGRSIEKARRWCTATSGAARMEPLHFDRAAPIGPQLAAASPDWLIDASGPFQRYSGDPYRVVRACIAHGIHYCDLADGAAFVEGVSEFDDAAKAAGVAVLSGVSSFPVLTMAVVRALAADLDAVDTVEGGIAPSPFAGVGSNVIRAIASYAGQRIAVVRERRRSSAHALTETRRFTIAPPGRVPVRSTLFSLVEVPELTLTPRLWPEVRSVWMGAGPVPTMLHRLLIGCAWGVRIGLVRGLDRLAPLMNWATNRLRWGEHRGGMYVQVTGRRGEGGASVTRSWHLLAEGADGPLIPSMAAAILVGRALDGRLPDRGARPALSEIELEDYSSMFRGRGIDWGIREDSASAPGLYPRLLGSAWDELPKEIQEMHGGPHATASGRAEVVRGKSLAARLIARLFRFPPGAADVPLSVAFIDLPNGGERWRRTFGAQGFTSVQTAGRGRFDRLLVERFGPLAFAIALVAEEKQLRLVLRHWTMLGIPMPLALGPWTRAREQAVNGRFSFDVEIGHPLAGSIVQYRGWLVPDHRSTPFAFPQARAAV